MTKPLRFWWGWALVLGIILLCFLLVQECQPKLHRVSGSLGQPYVTSDLSSNDDVLGRASSKLCDNILKPGERRYSNSTWTMFTFPNKEDITGVGPLYVFSAYYDERTSRRDVPSIRLLLSSSERLGSEDLFCQLWYHSVSIPYITRAEIILLGDYAPAHTNAYMVICSVYSTVMKPEMISLTSTLCENGSNAVRIVAPLHTRWQHEYGLCATQWWLAEGRAGWMVEWVELQRLLGVDHLTVYNASIPSKAGMVFESYVQSEQAELIQVSKSQHFTTRSLPSKTLPNFLHHIIANDCLLKNMYRYKYIIFSDFDEIILSSIMTKPSSYQRTTETFGMDNAMMKFKSRHVGRGETLTKMNQQNQLTSMTLSSASIINTDICTYMQGMNCALNNLQRQRNENSEEEKVATTESGTMSIYRFKNCSLVDKLACGSVIYQKEQGSQSSRDTFILKEKERLSERVKRRHEMIRLEYNW